MDNSEFCVAIIMSVYNGEKYLSQQLETIFDQKFRNITLYVRDDCSEDSTVEIVKSYAKNYNIVLIEGDQRLGAAQSFLTLLSIVPDSYSFYFFCDQDDWWESFKVSRAIDILQYNSDQPTLYCAKLELVDAHLNHLGYSRKPSFLRFENALVECVATGCAAAFNLPAKKILSLCTPRHIFMHDWWVYLVISAFGKVVYDDFPVIKYRQHDLNVVGSAHGYLGLFFRRIFRVIHRKNDGIFSMSAQARELLQCYRHMLSPYQIFLLQLILDSKNSIIKRCRLVFSAQLKRQSVVDDFLLRFMILFNQF